MAKKNCSICSTRHTYPWGNGTYSPYSRYREELEEYSDKETERKTSVNSARGGTEMSQWLNEAVHQSRSLELVKVVENRLQASMEDKFASLKTLVMQRVHMGNTETHRDEAVREILIYK